VDRLERLVNLVAALIDAQHPLSREEIHRRVGGYAAEGESFRRNFERDKDLLRQMGLPLELEPLDRRRPDGPQGYRIPRERYELPDPGLADDELEALRLAASTVSIEGGWGEDAATTALRKLAATTGLGSPAETRDNGHRREATAMSGPLPPAGLPGDERVAAVFGAVASRQAVRFRYRQVDRVVDPWHLAFRRGQWYLTGRDHDPDAERMFRLDRVDGAVEPVGPPGAFVRPAHRPGDAPPPWRLGDEPEVVADVAVDAAQARFVEAAVEPEAVTARAPDGSIRVRMGVTNRAGFRSFVLGLLDHAEVVGPPELRADMVAWLERLTANAT
jgi:proteasome accessory factor B